jgi:dTDP-4-dehydrorhamnose reductase
MTPLIFGASGQVGQALILECKKRRWLYTGTYHDHAIDPAFIHADLEDVDKSAGLVRTFRPSVVFMPSGFTWVDGCEAQQERARKVNALAPEAVAQECKKLGAALVFYSTDYVFGENGGPYTELAHPSPLGVYGQSKLEGEERVMAACPDALILRTTVVYGPEPQGKNTIYQLIRSLASGVAITMPSDQITSPTYNRDLARASVELVELLEKGIWNVAGSELLDRAGFARLAAAAFGLNGDLVQAAETSSMHQKARRPLGAGLLIEKLVQRLGWKPLSPIEGLIAMREELEASGQLADILKRAL